jgi:hypothetical protein
MDGFCRKVGRIARPSLWRKASRKLCAASCGAHPAFAHRSFHAMKGQYSIETLCALLFAVCVLIALMLLTN